MLITTAEIPPVKPDPRRRYWGKPDLTHYEQRLLDQIRRHGRLRLVFLRTGPIYLVGDHRVSAHRAEYLIQHHHVLPADRGLFEDSPPQSWRARP